MIFFCTVCNVSTVSDSYRIVTDVVSDMTSVYFDMILASDRVYEETLL